MIDTLMHKLSSGNPDLDQPHLHPRTFRREATSSGTLRLVAGMRDDDAALLSRLASHLTGPFGLLYVLHTPRSEGVRGRYQSPDLSLEDVAAFLSHYGTFIGCDARCDLWLRCFTTSGMLVWERHNLLYAYGPIDDFASILSEQGFKPGAPAIPSPHAHHYHANNDEIAGRLLAHWSWQQSPLHPEDEQ